ncbi:hypothetical protein AB733_12480 [Photobacterium swingsii]|uniref:Ornithine cyclodeaminase n=1 Tax=Photobacterium swingsii TaxID=680026 RepID=A0A0J8VCH0_9GAMM|nr:hypothetical protein [Photobacterium swingsii]KMV30230.1 hypothetical protein AB733_12480 [Photobacterium swingsii]PSW23307.1 hypothetical protein C9I94_16950 [Photobacterium swingsii]
MTKILKFSDCVKVDLFSAQVIEKIEECFIDYAKKNCNLESKIVLRKDGASFYTTMPAIYKDVMSVKSIQRDDVQGQPSIRGMLILNDKNSGELLSLMDSTYLTAVRTGLTAYISLKNTTDIVNTTKTVSVIGIGNAMVSFLKTLNNFKNEHQIRKIYVIDYKDHLNRVVSILDDDFEVEKITENNDLMNADIIVSAITSANGSIVTKFDENWKGKTIIPIHVRGWEHFDKEVDIITTDFYEQTKNWIRPDALELGDIILNNEFVKKRDSDVNVMSYNYGGALIDLVIADYIYKEAIKLGLGMDLDIWDMNSKYF